ncbi:MAG: gfo/Idh/MocA family oxidoreductase [Clostridiales bacterium]|nr:MAG: gfo/Idh/MocA family oxidoreductase [Clostridiales bacterium]
MKKIKAAVLGCGDRGCIYADYALRNPNELEIVAVADTNTLHREEARVRYSLPPERAFDSVEALIAAGIACDIVIDATMDEAHYPTAMALLQGGYDVLLEKPVCPNEKELLDLRDAAHRNGRRLIICHVLRYTPFYSAVKKAIDAGKIGRVRSIEMTEHVGMAHFIDSFVRGKWKSEKECGSGLLLAKCCHDVDLMCWLGDASRPARVTSLGFRENFVPRNAPAGATERCFDCPHEKTCHYSAVKIHLERDTMPFQTWAGIGKPLDAITREDKIEYMKHSAYGLCAYNSGGDIVDNQNVIVAFENGSMGTLNLVGACAKPERYLHIVGTDGEIEGVFEKNEFELRIFTRKNDRYSYDTETVSTLEHSEIGKHGGGDNEIMRQLVEYLRTGRPTASLTSIDTSIDGHLCVYAAEISRKEGRTVALSEFERS